VLDAACGSWPSENIIFKKYCNSSPLIHEALNAATQLPSGLRADCVIKRSTPAFLMAVSTLWQNYQF
jgi:hypothetical protein